MTSAIIWHNPRCSKSRQTLNLLEQAGVDVKEFRYLDEPINSAQLDDILQMLALEPHQILRTNEAIYKELKLKEKSLSRDEMLNVMVENPKLIERPIVIIADKAVVGRPPENIYQLL